MQVKKVITVKNIILLLAAIAAVFLYTIAPTFLDVGIERLGFLSVEVDDAGNYIRTITWTGWLLFIFLFLFVVLTPFVTGRSRANKSNEQQMEVIKKALELKGQIMAEKHDIQIARIKNNGEKMSCLPEVYTCPERLLKKMVNLLAPIVVNILGEHNTYANEEDISVSLAYLFDPPKNPDSYCSSNTKERWSWFHNNNEIPMSELYRFTGGIDEDGRQSSMRVALRKNRVFCKNKIDASNEKHYVRSDNDPQETLSGSIFCRPIIGGNGSDNNPVFVAAINIATHQIPFAGQGNLLRNVEWCLHTLCLSIENEIRVELLNHYIQLKHCKDK